MAINALSFPLCLVMTLLYSVSAAQVSGFVRDAGSGAPLAGAHIWVNQTTCGTTALTDGSFTLECNLNGTYDLVVSYLGYQAWMKSFELPAAGAFTVELEVNPQMLEEVTVVGSPVNRKKLVRQFEKCFLGYTSNARKCRIMNPGVLEFIEREETLEVHAASPIEIENQALGYSVRFLLEKALVNDPDIRYQGKALFTSLDDAGRHKKWIKNREKAYRGSDRHFFRSLIQGTSEKEGFHIWHALPSNEGMQRIAKARPHRLVEPIAGKPGMFRLMFNGYLEIEYDREKDHSIRSETKPRDFSALARPAEKDMMMQDRDRFRSPARNQVSWIRIREKEVILDVRGFTLGGTLLEEQGYWSNERIAEMLPLDFQ